MTLAPPDLDPSSRALVFGYGLHGQAVTTALRSRGHDVIVADDHPSETAMTHAATAGVELAARPSSEDLAALVETATHIIPTPGLPDHHPVFELGERGAVAVLSEFDLARQWDDRPIVAITGTNGKTTVTTMVTEMLVASGQQAVMAGNMEVPLVAAIEDDATEVFVVEASSFRLGHSARFAPVVGTWLNFDSDHLDVHASLAAYEAAKARIWTTQADDGIAIGNADDPVVMRNLPGRTSDLTFGRAGSDASVIDDVLVVGGDSVIEVGALSRHLPHDVANGLAAALTALTASASLDAVSDVLREFEGLAHRVQLVADADGVRWYNDSKATTPHAVLAGVSGFESAVLIAGGRNKGVDLTPMSALSPRLRAVVAIGEAAEEVRATFHSVERVVDAESMTAAVCVAAELARPGDAVILSPACTSYDWYPNYRARGEDFIRIVGDLVSSREAGCR